MKLIEKHLPLPTILLACLLFVGAHLQSCSDSDNNQADPTKEEEPEELACQSSSENETTIAIEEGTFHAPKTLESMVIDGCDKDAVWQNQDWLDMNYKWLGGEVEPTDYYGRFKLAWDADHLFVLVEVTDDFLNETLADGQDNYWKGDYVEVFIDEDQSGGDHKFNHQAFAYHVSTEGHAIDKNTLEETVFFDEHIEVSRTQEGNRYLWEMAIKIYDDSFDESTTDNIAMTLSPEKTMGFSIAYGDNDGEQRRENFMGSKKTHGINNDEGYINSDVFGTLVLKE